MKECSKLNGGKLIFGDGTTASIIAEGLNEEIQIPSIGDVALLATLQYNMLNISQICKVGKILYLLVQIL